VGHSLTGPPVFFSFSCHHCSQCSVYHHLWRVGVTAEEWISLTWEWLVFFCMLVNPPDYWISTLFLISVNLNVGASPWLNLNTIDKQMNLSSIYIQAHSLASMVEWSAMKCNELLNKWQLGAETTEHKMWSCPSILFTWQNGYLIYSIWSALKR